MNDATTQKSDTRNQLDPPGNPGQDTVNRYFSVQVVPPEGSPSEADKDTKHHSYFRLGMPDHAVEGKLPPDPNKPDTPGTAERSLWKDGIVLYTDGQYKQVAPSLSSTSKESLTINANEGSLATATYSTSLGDAGKYFFGPIQSTIAHQMQASSTLGLQVSGIFGESHTFWTGLRNTSGVGTNLTAVGGSDIKATTSQTISIGLGSTLVQGGGSARLTEKHDLFSKGDIRLSSSATHQLSLMTEWEVWRKATMGFLVLAAAMPPALTLGGIGVWGANQDEDKLKADLIGSAIAWTPLVAMATVIQVGISICTGLNRTVAKPDAIGRGLADPLAATLMLSNSNQTYLKKGAQTLTFGGPGGDVILANGPVGGATPYIQMSPADLTLSCGLSKIIINPSGVTILGPNVNVGSNATPTAGLLSLTAAGATLGGTPIMLNLVNAQGLATTQAAQVMANAAAIRALGVVTAGLAAEGFGALADGVADQAIVTFNL